MIKKLYILGVKLASKLGLYQERFKRYIMIISRLTLKFPVIKQGIILDLGCGNGWLTKHLQKIIMTIGADIKPSPSWNSDKGCFIVADARFLPIRGNAINVSVTLSLLEHVDNWKEIIHEAFRTLRPGGVLIIQLPNLKHIVEPHTKFPLLYLIPQPLKHTITKSAGYPELQFNCTIENVLKKAHNIGFKIQGIIHHHHGEKHNTIIKALLRISPHAFFLILQKPHIHHVENNINPLTCIL